MRIIAGRYGGRRLVAPRGRETRPTGDRVKEALFSRIGVIDGGRVLDLFAGTGALGLEALSRGASSVVLVESSSAALAALRSNVEALGCGDAAIVVGARAEQALTRLAKLGPFEWVFADPPWAKVREAVSLRAELRARGTIAGGALVVLEHDATDAPLVDGLRLLERRAYGDTGLSLFEPDQGEVESAARPGPHERSGDDENEPDGERG
jgi:16S rRNA (guanine966-N2)-methyltransferase